MIKADMGRDNKMKLIDAKKCLVLSIVEMICLLPATLICGIVACVFSANALASDKSGRSIDYKKQIGVARKALLIGLVLLILQLFLLTVFLCKLNFFKVPKEYYQLVLEGRYIELPMDYDKFEKLNFNIENDMSKTVINAGEYIDVNFGDDRYTINRYGLGQINVYNPSSDPIYAKDGVVVGIKINNISDLGLRKILKPIGSFAGGIHMTSNMNFTKKAIKKIAKTENIESSAVEGNYSKTYLLYGKRYKRNRFDMMIIRFMENGEISNITIKHM